MENNNAILFKDESYAIMGICFEVHTQLGSGFSEIVYKDALEYEFIQLGIPYEREKQFQVKYKETILPHQFFADFLMYDEIILEVKTISQWSDADYQQIMNYLCVSNLRLGIMVNFRSSSLKHKRVVL